MRDWEAMDFALVITIVGVFVVVPICMCVAHVVSP